MKRAITLANEQTEAAGKSKAARKALRKKLSWLPHASYLLGGALFDKGKKEQGIKLYLRYLLIARAGAHERSEVEKKLIQLGIKIPRAKPKR